MCLARAGLATANHDTDTVTNTRATDVRLRPDMKALLPRRRIALHFLEEFLVGVAPRTQPSRDRLLHGARSQGGVPGDKGCIEGIV